MQLQGDFQWPVPVFSAAKVDGKKLYEYARAGQDVQIPLKSMRFWDNQVEEASPFGVQLHIRCSKGSFIRTWADQLGRSLGVGGIIEELRRTQVGPWQVSQALGLDALTMDVLPQAFIPMAQALPGLKSIVANPKENRLIANGQVPKDLYNRLIFEQKQSFEHQTPVFVKVISATGDLLAILAAEPGQGLKIRRVFRTFA
jgi:tRNA pseudouridine55 synthase